MAEETTFKSVLSKAGDSILQKSGLGPLGNAIRNLTGRGKLKKGGKPEVKPFYGAQFAFENDFRAKIIVPSEYLTSVSTTGEYLGANGNNNNSIAIDGGIVFPYTPSISQDYSATYSPYSPTHSNYNLYFYKNSSPGAITVSGKFTVQNSSDAHRWLATVHLLRALTKMNFGNDSKAGAPPPVCRFSAYGPMQYKNVPVVIQTVKVELPDTVDYFVTEVLPSPAPLPGNAVPVSSTITVVLIPMYSRRELLAQSQVENFIGATSSKTKGFL